jgi:hypothetical protein
MADLTDAVNEITQALFPLPEGYYIEPNPEIGTIIVACKYPEPDGLGFAITKETIAGGSHVAVAENMFPELVQAVERARMANGADISHVE